MNFEEVIGFDLSHGEVASAKLFVGGDPTPKLLEIYGRKSQITALAHGPDGNAVIGEEAAKFINISHLGICSDEGQDVKTGKHPGESFSVACQSPKVNHLVDQHWNRHHVNGTIHRHDNSPATS
jgi:hypothetical protein